jgi:DNA-binding response OmpR family regulator
MIEPCRATLRQEERHQHFMDKIGAGCVIPLSYGDVVLDFSRRTLRASLGDVKLGGEKIALITWLLFRAQGSILSKDEIFDFLYYEREDKDLPVSNILEVYLSRIRTRLSTVSQHVTVQCQRGLGNYLVLV